MNRNMVYPGAIPLDTDVLTLQRNVMSAIGYLAQATIGTSTVVDGLACTPQLVPNMTVNIAPGSITALSTVDATAFGSLAADTTDPLVKMGVNTSTVVSSSFGTITAPSTSGQSINYLIEAAFQEADGTPVVLPYYNSANPLAPYSGPANAGTAQNTQRLQTVNLQLKTGTAATTGSQVTPTADSGFVPLYVITVAYAQTTIVAGNISQAVGAPFIATKLPGIPLAISNALALGLGSDGASYFKVANTAAPSKPWIVQQGFANIATGNGDIVTLPVAFPNAIVRVIATDSGSGCHALGWAVNGASLASFKAYGLAPGTSTPATSSYGYIAIGY